VTDFIQSSADIMILCKAGRPTDKAKELADIVVRVVGEVEKAVLRDQPPGERW
jgi:hypothetical protein